MFSACNIVIQLSRDLSQMSFDAPLYLSIQFRVSVAVATSDFDF